MNDLLKYFAKALNYSSLSLKKKGILIEKPWALIDNDGEIQKLIFKRDKGLILSKNGIVLEGSWDYFPEAKVILIDRIKDKLLLKEQFIDENVIILKKDGTDNDFFALANENTIPDYDIPKYLNSLKCKEFKIEQRKLINGNIIQIHNAAKLDYLGYCTGLIAEQIDSNYNTIDLPDGNYMTENRDFTFFIVNRKIVSAKKNIIKYLENGSSFEIEGGDNEDIYNNIHKKITINGKMIPDTRINDNLNLVYEINDSTISEIFIIKEYLLKNGTKIKIEQRDYSKIRLGDKIIDSSPIYPLPDGKYKVKGKWRKIEVINCIIS